MWASAVQRVAGLEAQDAALAARIEAAADTVADLGARVSQIDSAIEEPAGEVYLP